MYVFRRKTRVRFSAWRASFKTYRKRLTQKRASDNKRISTSCLENSPDQASLSEKGLKIASRASRLKYPQTRERAKFLTSTAQSALERVFWPSGWRFRFFKCNKKTNSSLGKQTYPVWIPTCTTRTLLFGQTKKILFHWEGNYTRGKKNKTTWNQREKRDFFEKI